MNNLAMREAQDYFKTRAAPDLLKSRPNLVIELFIYLILTKKN